MDSSPKGFPVKMFDAKERPVCQSDPVPVKAVTSCGQDYCYPFVKIRVAGRRVSGWNENICSIQALLFP